MLMLLEGKMPLLPEGLIWAEWMRLLLLLLSIILLYFLNTSCLPVLRPLLLKNNGYLFVLGFIML